MSGRLGDGLWRGRAVGPVLAVALVTLSILAAAEGPRLYVIDPARSQLRFHAVSRLMNADGSFGPVSGEIRVDPGRLETASGQISVEVASLDTGIRRRDNHLRSPDFFDVARHPTATFVVSSARRDGDRWTASGQLTIRGVTRPLVVPVMVAASADAIRIAGEFTVNRQEFGVTYQSVLNPIRDEVRVMFDLTAVPG